MTGQSKPTNVACSVAGKREIAPPIPLDRPARKTLQRGEHQTCKLRNVAVDADSPAFELSAPYFSSGSCEEWLTFRKNLQKALAGQNVATGPGSFTAARRLLEGEALTTFNNATNGLNETVASYNTGLDAATANVFPCRAVLLQKRHMRRFLRKPPEMKMREHVTRINELNNYLPSFPPITVGGASPDKLPDDKLLDLLEFGVPNSWQRNMALQDFDPLQKTVQDLVNFCERLEQVEVAKGISPAQNSEKSKNSKPNPKKAANSANKKRNANSGKDCMLHGEDCGHSSNECRTLKAQAKRMRLVHEAQTPEKKQSCKQAQELNATAAEAVAAALKEKKTKKRKKESVEELKKFEELSLSNSEQSDSKDSA